MRLKQFKVGDQVRLTGRYISSSFKGKMGFVTRINHEIVWMHLQGTPADDERIWDASELTLVTGLDVMLELV